MISATAIIDTDFGSISAIISGSISLFCKDGKKRWDAFDPALLGHSVPIVANIWKAVVVIIV